MAQQQAQAAPPPEEYQEPAPQPEYQEPAPQPVYQQPAPQPVPPPADPADQLEHLAQLHTSGVLTDEEFAEAKAKVLAS